MKYARFGFAALMVATACSKSVAPRPDFGAALTEHLRTIAERDLAGYRQTITTGDDLTIILPSGQRTTTRQEAIDLHSKWFSDPEWRIRFFEVQRIELDQVAIVVLRTFYRDRPKGRERQAWLTLTFALQNGSWRLVHDQNTRIRSGSK